MRCAWLLLLFLATGTVVADERILSFHSDIRVQADGWIDVTETIKVRAEGQQIRRGIFRDQYTEYRDRLGNDYHSQIDVLSVRRDGAREDFHTVDIEDGQRTYFGNANRFLKPGEYTYEYRYRASRLLGYFDDHDELYWTVTGFDWAFPIDVASARVSFEFSPSVEALRYEAYTGPYGARGQDYTARLDGNAIAFQSNKPLSAINGLTIVVGWPKGYVDEPSIWQRIVWVLLDNRNALIAVAGLLVLLAYYLPVWKRFGKDPDPGVIVTVYEPPADFSPASLRYILQMAYDDKVMTAALVSLATKGYLTIENDDDEHTIRKRDPGQDAEPLAAGESELLEALFGYGTMLALDNINHRRIASAMKSHMASLESDYANKYFKRNRSLNAPGFIIALGFSAAAFLAGPRPTLLMVSMVVLMFFLLMMFVSLMKQPTMRGRKLLDEVFGFRDYLEVAEKDELNLRNPPDKTPQLFERYLPYALALGVDQQWAEKFAEVLAAIRDPEKGGYRPGWYSGEWNTGSLSRATTQLSSNLHSAVRRSSQAPGSSSGGGGGGSSGGGGGGGGGGGW